MEVISTKETANKLDNFNKLLKENKVETYRGLVVGSLDASALYPSLDINKCCKIAAQRVIESGVEFEAFDVEWGSVYVALNMTQEDVYREKLSMIVPKPSAKNATGKNRPTITSIERGVKIDKWKWAKPIILYTQEEKQQILKKVLEIQSKTIFKSLLKGDTYYF